MENIHDINIYSEEVKDVLADPPKSLLRWGNTILLLFVVILLSLSYIIKYPDIVSGGAMLTTRNPPQKEHARASGPIDSIFVENNSIILANTHLAIVENTAIYDDVILLKAHINQIQINKGEVTFAINRLPLLFLGEIESDFALFENNYTLYTLNKQSNSYKSNNQNYSESLSQLKYRLQSLKGQKEINSKEISIRHKKLKRMESLFKSGTIAAQEFEEHNLEYLRAERDQKNINNSISQIEESISNTNNSKKQTNIENTSTGIHLLKAVIQSLDQLKRAIKDWEAKYIMTSKIDGKISFNNIWSKNQTVNEGDLVSTILPQSNLKYLCIVQVPITNSGKLEIGQSVNIRLRSYPHNEFGVLQGRVDEISLTPNNDGLYTLTINLPKNLKTTYGKKIEFNQEMLGAAEVITNDLRLIERIFSQFKRT